MLSLPTSKVKVTTIPYMRGHDDLTSQSDSCNTLHSTDEDKSKPNCWTTLGFFSRKEGTPITQAFLLSPTICSYPAAPS